MSASNPSSSRPMTLRQQQLNELWDCFHPYDEAKTLEKWEQLCQGIAREAYRTGAQDYNRVFTDKLGKCTYMEGGQAVYKQVWVGDAVRKANREVISKGNGLVATDPIGKSSPSNPPESVETNDEA